MPEYQVPVVHSLPPAEDATCRRVVFVTNRTANSLEYLGLMQVFAEAQYRGADLLRKAPRRGRHAHLPGSGRT
jgi:hypothetical protein